MKRLFIAILSAACLPVTANALESLPFTCTEAGGEAFGRSGEAYRGGCPVEAERAFLSGYIVGRRIFAAQSARDNARHEYEEASAAIDFHAEKVAEARVRNSNPDSTKADRRDAQSDAEHHRQQILLAEKEAEKKHFLMLDAYGHYQEAIDGLPDWKESEEFAFAQDMLTETQAFARAELAIDYCTDELDYGFYLRPHCLLAGGAVVHDVQTGDKCATGPSEAVLLRRGLSDDELAPNSAFLQVFNTFARDENGKNQQTGFFAALFDGGTKYQGTICPIRE